MNLKRTAALLAAAVFAAALSGCKPGGAAVSRAASTASRTASTAAAAALPATVPAAVNVSLGPEPLSLDPALSAGTDTDSYCAAAFEGLYKVDASGNVVLGQAQKATCTTDKKTWTFTLRTGAKWSDGKPVRAQDFVYAWRRNVQLAAAPQRNLFMYLKNGKELLDGSSHDAYSLGVTAVNDHTLRVHLVAACDFLPQLLTRPVFMPLRTDNLDDAGAWSRSPATFLCNGPMKLSSWRVKSDIVFVPNDQYYNHAAVTATRLTCALAEDDEARLSAYDNNETSFLAQLPVKYFARIRERGDFTAAPAASTACLQFNTTASVLTDVRVRRALSLALDRDTLSAVTTGMRFTAAAALVPTGFTDAAGHGDFRTIGGSLVNTKSSTYAADVSAAKALLEQAGYSGGSGLPQLTISVPNSSLDTALASAAAQMWKDELGVNCKVDTQPYKTYAENCRQGSVQMTVSTLTADYNDPSALLEKFAAANDQNITAWHDTAYGTLLQTARMSGGTCAARYQALHSAEKRLLTEAAAVPLVHLPTMSLHDAKYNGIFTRNGTFYFAYATQFNG